jgi:peptidoglycan/LPS O-acetylase OafA/YrhL
MDPKSGQRNLQIDTLRGLACIMVVVFHVIGLSPECGLRLNEGALKATRELLGYIHMPLFAFLSGLVYGWRPFSGNWGVFIEGKIRRLIIPMLVVGTGYVLLQAITPGANNTYQEWQYMHIKPVAHFWFSESIFIIFLAIAVLEHFQLLGTRKRFGIVYIAAVIPFIANMGTIWFSLVGAIYLLPFFLAGLYCTRFPLRFTHPRTKGYLAIVLTGIFLLLFGQHNAGDDRSALALVIATLLCIALLLTEVKINWLDKVGYYSYSIYIFHVFFTAASRIGLMKSGVTNIWALFIVGSVAGIIGPVLVETIAARHDYSRILLLGQKPSQRS